MVGRLQKDPTHSSSSHTSRTSTSGRMRVVIDPPVASPIWLSAPESMRVSGGRDVSATSIPYQCSQWYIKYRQVQEEAFFKAFFKLGKYKKKHFSVRRLAHSVRRRPDDPPRAVVPPGDPRRRARRRGARLRLRLGRRRRGRGRPELRGPLRAGGLRGQPFFLRAMHVNSLKCSRKL